MASSACPFPRLSTWSTIFHHLHYVQGRWQSKGGGGKWHHMPPEQLQAVLTLNHRGSGTVLHGWTPIFQRIFSLRIMSNTSVPNPPHVCTFQVNWMTWTKSDNWSCPIPKGSTLGKHRKHKLGCSLRAKCSTRILRYLWGLWDIMGTFGLCM